MKKKKKKRVIYNLRSEFIQLVKEASVMFEYLSEKLITMGRS